MVVDQTLPWEQVKPKARMKPKTKVKLTWERIPADSSRKQEVTDQLFRGSE